MSRRKQGGDGSAAGSDDDGVGTGFALPLSLLAAVVISSPVLLAGLQGRVDARTALGGFAVALAAVWFLGALGARAVGAMDRSTARRVLRTSTGGTAGKGR